MNNKIVVALVSLSVGDVVRGAESGLPRANLGLFSLQSALQREGLNSVILDGDDTSLNDEYIIEYLTNERPRIAGFSVSQVNTARTIAAIRQFRNSTPDSLVVLGGHHASIVAAHLLTEVPEIDCVVVGDGEEPLCQLARMLNTTTGVRFEDVAGLAFRAPDGIRINTPISIQDPNQFPLTGLTQVGKGRDIAIMASRGCLANCGFCVSPCFARLSQSARWRPRSPENIIAEVEHLTANKSDQMVCIHFHDADFLGKGPRAVDRGRRIAELILERGIKADFRFACRADTAVAAGSHFWRVWKRAGLVKVYLGLESGCDSELEMYCKGTSVAVNFKACELIKNCGLAVQIGFIMFHPYSTLESVHRNLLFLRLVEQGHLYGLVASSLVIYPGTGLFERFRKENLLRYERIYLPIDVECSSADISDIRDILFGFRQQQYPQDRLCLDLEFAISAEKATVDVEGIPVRIDKYIAEQYARYKTERAGCMRSWVVRLLHAPSIERRSLAHFMESELTSRHECFVRLLGETLGKTHERSTPCFAEVS